MSRTLNELIAGGFIQPVRARLLPGESPFRRLFICPEFRDFISSLSRDERDDALQSELDEVAAVASQFIAGRKLSGTITRVSPPAGEGLFKLHTSSFRLFGWCPAEQTLILACGARKLDLISEGGPRTKDCGRQVVAIRKAMDAAEPINGEWNELFRPRD